MARLTISGKSREVNVSSTTRLLWAIRDDVPTAVVGLVSLGLLWRFKIPEPILVAAAGIVGLIAFPLLRP